MCCILFEYVKRTGDIFMAISTQDIDFTDPICNLGPDSTTVFGEPPSNRTEHLSSENLSAASKVDDDDEDDMEDDEDDEDEDEGEDGEEDLDDEEDEDEDDEDEEEEEEDDDNEDVDELQVRQWR
jgi:hypothetical protein